MPRSRMRQHLVRLSRCRVVTDPARSQQPSGLTEATYSRRMANGAVAGRGEPGAQEPLKLRK